MIKHVKNKLFLILGLSLISVFIFFFINKEKGVNIPLINISHVESQHQLSSLPDFSKITVVKEKKETFFNTLFPIIEEEMKHILALRKLVIQLQQISIGEQTNEQKSWLQDLALHYKLNTDLTESNFFELLLKRVDVIPPSLALAQAAIESGWGTSRFSKQGNNLFGQWCFSRGCGMVPASRDSGKAHEVAKFTTVNLAIRAYIINLNTNLAYTELRKKRAFLRQKDQKITGLLLAEKLNKYSEEGDLYVKKLVQFINQNKLQRFTDKFNDTLIPKQEESKV